jgi:hypothetical protein
MKRFSSFSALFVLLIAGLLTFTACDANSLTGTEDTTSEQTVQTTNNTDDPPSEPDMDTEPETGHNTGCPAGDPECG